MTARMVTPAELHKATAEAALRLDAGGVETAAEGATLRCTFPGGIELVLRNRLAPDASFDRERLLNNMAVALLMAEGARD